MYLGEFEWLCKAEISQEISETAGRKKWGLSDGMIHFF